jgi:predicted nucleotidyltransferase
MPKKSSNSVRIFYPKYSKEKAIKKVTENLEVLHRKLPLLLVSLFGSYAKGNYTAASDIDLLVVYRGKEKKDAYGMVKKAIEIYGLEPHVYSEDEYRENKDTITKMIKDGIIIYREGA